MVDLSSVLNKYFLMALSSDMADGTYTNLSDFNATLSGCLVAAYGILPEDKQHRIEEVLGRFGIDTSEGLTDEQMFEVLGVETKENPEIKVEGNVYTFPTPETKQ